MEKYENEDKILKRREKGEMQEEGGERRIDGDIKEDFRDKIRKGNERKVIMMIGEGMGD